MSLHQEAMTAFRRGDNALAARLGEQELTRARAAGDAAGEVEALCMLARVAVRDGAIAEGQRLGLEARAIARGAGDRRLELAPAHIAAGCARIAGDLASARTLYAESIALSEEFGTPDRVAREQHNLVFVELRAGEPDRAREWFAASRRRVLELGMADFLPYTALAAAMLADLDGDQVRSARLLAAVDGALEAAGQVLDPDDAIEHTALRARLVEALGQQRFDSTYAAGAGIDLRTELAG